jgi:hypothetical protein
MTEAPRLLSEAPVSLDWLIAALKGLSGTLATAPAIAPLGR